MFLSAIPIGKPRKIAIITKDCGTPDLPCKVTAVSPSGQTSDLPTSKNPEGYECTFTPNEPGEYKVKVEYASKELPKSPYTATVEGPDLNAKKGKPEEQIRKFVFFS